MSATRELDSHRLQALPLLGAVLAGGGDECLRLVETGLSLHERGALLGVQQPRGDAAHQNLTQDHDDEDRERQGGGDHTQVQRRSPPSPSPADWARHEDAHDVSSRHQTGPALYPTPRTVTTI